MVRSDNDNSEPGLMQVGVVYLVIWAFSFGLLAWWLA